MHGKQKLSRLVYFMCDKKDGLLNETNFLAEEIAQ